MCIRDTYMCVWRNEEPVYSVVLRALLPFSVHSASGDYGDVCVLTDEEIVIYQVRHVAVGYTCGDIHGFSL